MAVGRFRVEDREDPRGWVFDIYDSYIGQVLCTVYDEDRAEALCKVLNSWGGAPGEIML